VAKPDVAGAEVGHVAVNGVEGMKGLKVLFVRVSDGDGMGRGASHPMTRDGRSRGVVPHV